MLPTAHQDVPPAWPRRRIFNPRTTRTAAAEQSNADHHVGGFYHREGRHADLQAQFLGRLVVVMEAVIVTVGDTSIVTCVVVAPGLTVLIVPAI
jgi:hypothetical protein